MSLAKLSIDEINRLQKLAGISKLVSDTNTSLCEVTLSYINGNISLNKYKLHIESLQNKIESIGLNEDLASIRKWFDDNVLSKIHSISSVVSNNIEELSESVVKRISLVIKSVVKIAARISKKFPQLFKIGISLTIIIVLLTVIGVVNAYAADINPQSTVLFDTMVGLLEIYKETIMSDLGIDMLELTEAKLYIQDLKDGKLDLGEVEQGIIQIHDYAKVLLDYLMDNVDDTDMGERTTRVLMNALEIGKNTTIKTIKGASIDSTGNIKFN